MYTRREAILVLGSAALLSPQRALAQQESKAPRIGFLTRATSASVAAQIGAFRQGLSDLGWVEGKSISIEFRDAAGQADRLAALASELVALNVDVIVTVDTPPTQAAKRATSTIPIVIAVSADPVGAGLISSLSHPGGNITGLSTLAPDTDQKSLELLTEMLPSSKRVAMIFDPNNQATIIRLNAVKAAALKLALDLQSISAPTANELGLTLTSLVNDPPDALVVLSPIYSAYRPEIVQFAIRTRAPLSFDDSGLAEEPNALFSYGADRAALFRRAATFVDKILKGAPPGDLPVEQPTKFELVINVRTAKALGLAVSPSVLVLADKVIE
jgi:putative ABC transport system substrate-binding protein